MGLHSAPAVSTDKGSLLIKLGAIGLGVICHASFLLAVFAMMIALFGEMNSEIVSFPFAQAVVYDIILLLQFPILHSLMLRPAGRRWLSRIVPEPFGKHLVTTTFVIAASIQILALFALWAHLGGFDWRPSGVVLVIWSLVYSVSWIVLGIAMVNAGLGTQLGYLGWTSVFRGEQPTYPSFPRTGLYRVCRHPVYFAMALVACTGPIWNLDHLIVAGVFLVYCIFGPITKERRLIARYGSEYTQHFAGVPFFPTPASCWRRILEG